MQASAVKAVLQRPCLRTSAWCLHWEDRKMAASDEPPFGLNSAPEKGQPAPRRYRRGGLQVRSPSKKKLGWQFVFLAANQDAIATVPGLRIDAADALNFVSDQAGTADAYPMHVRQSRRKAPEIAIPPPGLSTHPAIIHCRNSSQPLLPLRRSICHPRPPRKQLPPPNRPQASRCRSRPQRLLPVRQCRLANFDSSPIVYFV